MNRPYAHIRSSKSTSLGCDAFIWADIVAPVLLIEFKSHLTLVSSATLQRWMKELDPDSRSEFSPQKVVMHLYGVMSYAIEPVVANCDRTPFTLFLWLASNRTPGTFTSLFNRSVRFRIRSWLHCPRVICYRDLRLGSVL
ncbi:hypothetical protein ARMSODRAFT_1090821 [Armillaria solidipes]|uniref:Uncharacterized protein n=1 Tax=Armillaria solidipes TaxID=1076256 RepID=A0A2H3AKG2_9AGAR|nr:hypothetical protein ARMSODRAFT_1090821 [Armillaria solidipes]